LLLSTTTATATVTKASPLLDRKIEEITAGLLASFAKHLCSTGEENAAIIIEYIAAVKNDQYILCTYTFYYNLVRRMIATITQIESVVTPSGNSGHVVVPKAWIGNEAIVTLKDSKTKGKK
jgi:putative transposon-encoded protein